MGVTVLFQNLTDSRNAALPHELTALIETPPPSPWTFIAEVAENVFEEGDAARQKRAKERAEWYASQDPMANMMGGGGGGGGGGMGGMDMMGMMQLMLMGMNMAKGMKGKAKGMGMMEGKGNAKGEGGGAEGMNMATNPMAAMMS